MSVILYGCVTIILRVGHKLQVFDNKVLRRVFGPKNNQQFRILHTAELGDLYRSPRTEFENNFSCGNPLGRLRMRWQSNITVHAREKKEF
jgi:hypothetical protein